ncbi:MAG: GNAT family N-acetyltransferase [Deltaproteobacteria bacterium]|nr:GNAT family N-acetyltransferase [Deltaproteobacteria bacterium]
MLGERGPRARVRANRAAVRTTLAAGASHGLVLGVRDPGLVGALVSVPPRGWPLPPPGLPLRLWAIAVQGLGAARRWAEAFDALAAHHPILPHWYLGTLGVDPTHQQRGLGGALLEAWLRHVDADRCGVWLETDRPENIAFYERAGFELAGEVPVFDVPVWLMSRPPAPAQGDTPAQRDVPA